MTDSTWDTRNRHKFAGVPVLSSKGRRLSLQSLEIIQRYRDGQRPIGISQEMGLPYQNVIGVVHSSLTKHIARGMTEEVYFAIVKRMTAGGFKSFSEYMVEAAVDAHYAEEELEAKLAKAREEGFWAGRSCGGSKEEIKAALAEEDAK